MSLVGPIPGEVLGFSVALGIGLLIGIERERRKGQGPGRQAAGIRSFTLAALIGALAQGLLQPTGVAVAGAAVGLLAALAYLRSPPEDPGMTTELALFVTFLLGVLSMVQPALGAGAAAVVALLLALREGLHDFATRALSEGELRDALMLAALILVVLPLLPAEPVAWMAGLRPRTLGMLVVLILVLQAAGHAAGRVVGARAGLALAGLFSGFVSSTATIAAMGGRVRSAPDWRPAFEAGAILSTASTWIQAAVMLVALTPALALVLAPVAAVGAVVALATGLWRARRFQLPVQDGSVSVHGPLRVREAALVAAVLTAVALAVGWAQRAYGDAGALTGSAISAVVDAHAAVVALGVLHANDRAETPLAVFGVLLAISVNAVTRATTAYVAGGAAFGHRVTASLLASSGAAWATAAFSGLLG